MDQIYLKGQYGSNCIVPRYKFTKNISRSHKKSFYTTLSRIFERTILFQCYCIPTWIYWKCFANTTETIFDKDWLNWSKWTIRVNLYCLTFNCQGYFKVEKSAFKGQYAVSRILSWYELARFFQTICTSNQMCFCYTFINFILIRRYASNNISIESIFFMKQYMGHTVLFLNEVYQINLKKQGKNKIDFVRKLLRILERTMWLKLYLTHLIWIYLKFCQNRRYKSKHMYFYKNWSINF